MVSDSDNKFYKHYSRQAKAKILTNNGNNKVSTDSEGKNSENFTKLDRMILLNEYTLSPHCR